MYDLPFQLQCKRGSVDILQLQERLTLLCCGQRSKAPWEPKLRTPGNHDVLEVRGCRVLAAGTARCLHHARGCLHSPSQSKREQRPKGISRAGVLTRALCAQPAQ